MKEPYFQPGREGKIVILGAGPCGLGASWRLKELGYSNFEVYDSQESCGGLASTEVDDAGFLWDLGGHVIFSHYQYFDSLLDYLIPEWCVHDRNASIWMRQRFIPYPLQSNIHHLPPVDIQKCLEGLLKVEREKNSHTKPKNFHEWLKNSFGEGLMEIFMTPYNQKVWGVSPTQMNVEWMGERVALVDLAKIMTSIVTGEDQTDWGPNRQFRFPLKGGTGSIWSSLQKKIGDQHFNFNSRAIQVNAKDKYLVLEGGRHVHYDHLVSTIPLDMLCGMVRGGGGSGGGPAFPGPLAAAPPSPTTAGPVAGGGGAFRRAVTHVVGLGFSGTGPPAHLAGRCWIYFPEPALPFYRATVFSTYSPHNVPRPGKQWSLMLEMTETSSTPQNQSDIIDHVISGALEGGLLCQEDCTNIISRFHRRLSYGYPVPFLERDSLCKPIFKTLEEHCIYSRGRFGSWKYEISNQDHTMMQGVEVIDRILFGTEEVTFHNPAVINSGNHHEISKRKPVIKNEDLVVPLYHDASKMIGKMAEIDEAALPSTSQQNAHGSAEKKRNNEKKRKDPTTKHCRGQNNDNDNAADDDSSLVASSASSTLCGSNGGTTYNNDKSSSISRKKRTTFLKKEEDRNARVDDDGDGQNSFFLDHKNVPHGSHHCWPMIIEKELCLQHECHYCITTTDHTRNNQYYPAEESLLPQSTAVPTPIAQKMKEIQCKSCKKKVLCAAECLRTLSDVIN